MPDLPCWCWGRARSGLGAFSESLNWLLQEPEFESKPLPGLLSPSWLQWDKDFWFSAGLALGLVGVDAETGPSGGTVLSAPTSSWRWAAVQWVWAPWMLPGLSQCGLGPSCTELYGVQSLVTSADPGSPPCQLLHPELTGSELLRVYKLLSGIRPQVKLENSWSLGA